MVTYPGIPGRMVSAACIAMAVLLFPAGMTAGRNPFYGTLFIMLSLLLVFAGISFLGKRPEWEKNRPLFPGISPGSPSRCSGLLMGTILFTFPDQYSP